MALLGAHCSTAGGLPTAAAEARALRCEAIQVFLQGDLGSRRDRHANLGEGRLGRTPFRRLVNDPRLAEVPMVLETPGGLAGYRRDLRILRGMRRK